MLEIIESKNAKLYLNGKELNLVGVNRHDVYPLTGAAMPYEQLKQLQNERLVKQVQHVWDNVPYYRQKMEAKGLTPDDIKGTEDLHKLPFVTKDDLRECYPYGLLAKPLAVDQPTKSELARPGPRVAAMASISFQLSFASSIACLIMPGRRIMWQREAISGTTPP